MGFSVKKGDYVQIIAGKDKGKTAQITGVNSEEHRVLIEGKGIKENVKAVKARKANDKGGLVKQASTIDISNVQPICSACGKATRVGFTTQEDGEKVRICKKCGAVLVTKDAGAKKGSKKAEKVVADEKAADSTNKKIRRKSDTADKGDK